MTLERFQDPATTTAAQTHPHSIFGVGGLHDESGLIGILENIKRLLEVNLPAQAIAYAIIHRRAEPQTTLLPPVTLISHYVLRTAADAGSNRESLLRPDQFFGHLVRHHFKLWSHTAANRNGA